MARAHRRKLFGFHCKRLSIIYASVVVVAFCSFHYFVFSFSIIWTSINEITSTSGPYAMHAHTVMRRQRTYPFINHKKIDGRTNGWTERRSKTRARLSVAFIFGSTQSSTISMNSTQLTHHKNETKRQPSDGESGRLVCMPKVPHFPRRQTNGHIFVSR